MSEAAEKTKSISESEYEFAAKAYRWEYSAAHGGWVHPDERRGSSEADYAVMDSAEEACWLHEIDPRGGTPFAYANGEPKHFVVRA